MSLDDFYINNIAAKKKGNTDIYIQTLKDIFGKVLSWSEVKALPRDDQMTLMLKLDKKIKIEKSPYDINKLASAIQSSRSGFGLSVLTNYECKFCGNQGTWGNSATPGICYECATKMAENIVKYNIDILK